MRAESLTIVEKILGHLDEVKQLLNNYEEIVQAEEKQLDEVVHFEVDLLHILESVQLNAPEIAKISKSMRNNRVIRRDLKNAKYTKEYIAPRFDDLRRELNAVHATFTRAKQKSNCYLVRTDAAMSIVRGLPNLKERSAINFHLKKEVNEMSQPKSNQQAPMSVAKAAHKVNVRCELKKRGKDYLLYEGRELLFKTASIHELLEKLESLPLIPKIMQSEVIDAFRGAVLNPAHNKSNIFASRVCKLNNISYHASK